MIDDNVISYLKYEISTKTRVINEFCPIFPTITICKIIFFPTKLVSKLIEELKEDFNEYDSLNVYFKMDSISKLRSTKNKQLIKDFGNSKKKIIFSCFFRLTLNKGIDGGFEFMNGNLGAILLIHNRNTYPMMVDEITVAPETETNIGLSRTFY